MIAHLIDGVITSVVSISAWEFFKSIDRRNGKRK